MMQKTTIISKSDAIEMRDELLSLAVGFAKKYGLDPSSVNVAYNADSAVCSFNLCLKYDPSASESDKAERFRQAAKLNGFAGRISPDWFGAGIPVDSERGRIVGIDTADYEHPVLVEMPDGSRFSLSPLDVKNIINSGI